LVSTYRKFGINSPTSDGLLTAEIEFKGCLGWLYAEVHACNPQLLGKQED
jgi:hypothetical protein